MFLSIGEIVKAQGIKGEVKIKPHLTDSSIFDKLKAVYFDGTPYKLRTVNVRGGFAYVAIDGVNDRNEAEKLIGKTVYIDRSDAPKPIEGEYYICDLIGCSVALSDGKVIGKITDVCNYGSADVFTVEGDAVVRFPYLNKLVLSVDISLRIVTLDKKVFGEVCVYED